MHHQSDTPTSRIIFHAYESSVHYSSVSLYVVILIFSFFSTGFEESYLVQLGSQLSNMVFWSDV